MTTSPISLATFCKQVLGCDTCVESCLVNHDSCPLFRWDDIAIIQLTSSSELLQKARQLYDLLNWSLWITFYMNGIYIFCFSSVPISFSFYSVFCNFMKEMPSLRYVLQLTFLSLFFKVKNKIKNKANKMIGLKGWWETKSNRETILQVCRQ